MDMDWLKAELKRRRVTQADVARAIGMSEVTLSKCLNGSRIMKVAEGDAIRAFLGYRVPGHSSSPQDRRIDELLGQLDAPQKRQLELYLAALVGAEQAPGRSAPEEH